MPSKILTVVGARPQFIKAAPVSVALRAAGHHELLLHTGQHYDAEMSSVFFEELALPPPAHHLGVGSGGHGAQTGAMLAGIERVLLAEQPDWVLVYGDTNSTLAGALAASKLHIPIAHVEAGLRSFNRRMPEEVNRVLTDHLSRLMFAPSRVAIDNLAREGIHEGVHDVGDVMAGALALAEQRCRDKPSAFFERLAVSKGRYLLVTLHRAENTDGAGALQTVLDALRARDEPVVFPVHPRTRPLLAATVPADVMARLESDGLGRWGNFRFTSPVGYLDMVRLEGSARAIVTDSGGVQKEAYWLRVPCITLRPETEWIETVQTGWNRLSPMAADHISIALDASTRLPDEHPPLYGSGDAAERIASLIR